MSGREHIDDLLADQAIWGLDESESLELEQALGEAEADTSLETAAAMIMATYADWNVSVPNELLSKLQGDAIAHCVRERSVTFGSVASAIEATRASGELSEPRRVRRGFMPWLLAAAAVVVAALAGWERWLATELSADEQRAVLVAESPVLRIKWKKGPSELSGEPSGDIVWSATEQRGFMRFRGLPANEPTEKQYQLWIFDRTRSAEKPVDGGVFDIPAGGGNAVVPIDAKLFVGEAFAFAVTLEEPGGVVVSDREHIVATAGL